MFNSTAPIVAPPSNPKSAPARSDAAPGGSGFAALLDAPAAPRDRPAARAPERNTISSSDTAAPRDERTPAADGKTTDPKTTDASATTTAKQEANAAGGDNDTSTTSDGTNDTDAAAAPALATVVPTVAAVVAPPTAPIMPGDGGAPAVDATTASPEQLALASVENNGVAITVSGDDADASASRLPSTAAAQTTTGLFAAGSAAAQGTMVDNAVGRSTAAFDAPDPDAIETTTDPDATQPAKPHAAAQANAKPAEARGNSARNDAANPTATATRGATDATAQMAAATTTEHAAQGGQPQLSPLHAGAHISNQMQQAPQPTVALLAPGVAVPLAGVAMNLAANARAGKSQFDIQLDPAELGRIDVRLTVDRHGTVTSHVVVEKAETLDMLRRDAQQLQRALDDAGLKTGSGGLQFSLRDQSSSPDRDDSGSSRQQRIIVSEDVIASEVAGRSYGRAMPTRGGLDIRI